MSLEIGIKVQKNSIPICAVNAELDCKCFNNNGIMMDGSKEDQAWLVVVEQKEKLTYCMSIEGDGEINREGEWYSDILQYLKEGTYLKSTDKNDQLTIRRLFTNYIMCYERMYRRLYGGIHLLCVTAKEAQQVIKEVHELGYGSHMNAHMLS